MNMRAGRALTAIAGVAGVFAIGLFATAGAALNRERSGPTTLGARTAASTPVLIAGSYRGRRPRTIGISGDGGNIVTSLRWSRWTTTRATGKGTSDIQGCVPNCAAGTETPVTTSITLSRPVHGYFTKLLERRDGQTETFTYTPGHLPNNWPGDAS
jgi:hypothetical protein